MVGTGTRFTGKQALCGKNVDGEHYEDDDKEGLIIWDERYACGCRRTRSEYHDGSVHTLAVRHDGTVLVDDFGPEHGG